MGLDVGEIVCSRAGRDCGKLFVIVGTIGNAYVLVTDGKLRKVEKPKKKKIKHIQPTGEAINTLAEKIKSGQKIINSEVRKSLAAHVSKFHDVYKVTMNHSE